MAAEGLNELLLILVISSWVNIALYTSELVLCGRYFGRPSRPLVHKIGVALLVFADTVCTLAISIDVCLAVLRLPIENPRLLVVPTTVEIMTTYISAVVAQLFLCNLFYVLTESRIVAGAIFVLIFVHLGFSWAAAIISNHTLNYVGIAFTTTTVGAISCAATDVVIAIALSWKFGTMMGRIRRANSTRSLLRHILILTVSCGAIDASSTLVMMILLLKKSNFAQVFFTCQGRVYSLTILGNFLMGIPIPDGGETSAIRHSRTSISTGGIFQSTAPETSISPTNRPKSNDRFQSRTSGHLSLPHVVHELDDFTFAPVFGKTESEQESTSHCT
ncbi:hypothetical protein DFH06DRAFT_618942 [Mycena polygramma]|nr:hypothetical protein DFH06DRAFT_618942 [Mycena polygramma]